MKIGIFSDVHSNINALEFILNEFERMECKKIICCGDIISIGAFPEETVQRLMRLPNLISVCGNHEKYITECDSVSIYPDLSEHEREHHRWQREQLSDESKEFLNQLPNEAEYTVSGVRLKIVHYQMSNKNHFLNVIRNPEPEKIHEMFSSVSENADVILYGHDHAETYITHNGKIYINCGSLGCPSHELNLARAGILIIENGEIHFQNIRIRYGIQPVLDEINRLRYPEYKFIKSIFYGIK